MSDNESKNFENADLISLVSAPEIARPSTKDEIERGRKLYEDRHRYKDTSDVVNLQPLYDKSQIKKRTPKTKNPFNYQLICDYPKVSSRPNVKPCRHTGNFILDRDILTRLEHDTFLARPKMTHASKASHRYCYHQKKYFSRCTYRIEELSLPKKQKLVQFYNEFADQLSPQKSENIARMLIDANVTNIARAIEMCNDEKRKHALLKKRNLRETTKVKRKILKEKKIMVHKISFNVFAAMKDSLLTDQDLTFNKNIRILADVIANQILLYEDEIHVERTSNNALAKCVYGIADGLAVWMHSITKQCGFGSLLENSITTESEKVSKYEPYTKQIHYPIDDYIEYESSIITECSTSTLSEYEDETDDERSAYEGYEIQNVNQTFDLEDKADDGHETEPKAFETAVDDTPPEELAVKSTEEPSAETSEAEKIAQS